MRRISVLGICSAFLALVATVNVKETEFEGTHAKSFKEYEVLVPVKVDQDGKFLSYSLTQFYDRDALKRKKRNAPGGSETLYYGLKFNGKIHHVEMWPNNNFMSPGLVIEERGAGAALDFNKVTIRPVKYGQCHYTGRVRGHKGSRLALSVCDGLSGYIKTNQGQYFVEPMKGQEPQADGKQVHIIYKASEASAEGFGTGGWKDGWRERLRWNHRRTRDTHADLETDATLTIESKHWYLELLVVADKAFLDYHNNTDAETYILTIMNMVADIFRDASVGNRLDIVVVRIIYLRTQEDEFDLHISQIAGEKLERFCKWQVTVNPGDEAHPNHHDIAVLLTRVNMSTKHTPDFIPWGRAYGANACKANTSCAICKDSGLVLSRIVAHEIGHLIGCGHDNGVETVCMPVADDGNRYIMSPGIHMSSSGWSSCSRESIQEFLENGLGDCLLDEPQDHVFRLPQMPPGAMYDANFQCAQRFRIPGVASCDMGPETNCKELHCEDKPNKCVSRKEPPADGTRCAANMWCYNQTCVPTGQRPQARDGAWGTWGPWSTCSRTCGGGISFKERDCNDPVPLNHGTYCLGERKKYHVCNSNPCDPEAATFREHQCSQHNNDTQQWTPLLSTEPQNVCKLQCRNEAGMVETLAPRAKDGTPCRPGTKDMCVAGQCRVVGCDWVLGSDAVEDRCGVCQGNGTECG